MIQALVCLNLGLRRLAATMPLAPKELVADCLNQLKIMIESDPDSIWIIGMQLFWLKGSREHPFRESFREQAVRRNEFLMFIKDVLDFTWIQVQLLVSFIRVPISRIFDLELGVPNGVQSNLESTSFSKHTCSSHLSNHLIKVSTCSPVNFV